jgi:hypothetical protein
MDIIPTPILALNMRLSKFPAHEKLRSKEQTLWSAAANLPHSFFMPSLFQKFPDTMPDSEVGMRLRLQRQL